MIEKPKNLAPEFKLIALLLRKGELKAAQLVLEGLTQQENAVEFFEQVEKDLERAYDLKLGN